MPCAWSPVACAHRGFCRDRGRHNGPDDRLVHRRRTGRSGSRPAACRALAADHAVLCRVCRAADCAAPAREKVPAAAHRPHDAAGNIGREAIVTEAIDNLHETGAVRLSGVEWSARSADGSPVAAGTVVRIDAIEGVKLIVTPIPVSHK